MYLIYVNTIAVVKFAVYKFVIFAVEAGLRILHV